MTKPKRVPVPGIRPTPTGIPLPVDIDAGLECPYREFNTGYWEQTYEVVEDGYYNCTDCDSTSFPLWAPPRIVDEEPPRK